MRADEWDRIWNASRALQYLVLSWAVVTAVMFVLMAINAAVTAVDRHENGWAVLKDGQKVWVNKTSEVRPAKWDWNFIIYPNVPFAAGFIILSLNGGMIVARRRFSAWRQSEAVENRKKMRELEALSEQAERETHRLQKQLDEMMA